MIKKIILFLILNFLALFLGGLTTRNGVLSDWYLELNKAPWTPPGWAFGVIWTLIMILFAIYMANVWEESKNKKQLAAIFGLQWVLNIIWNPIFFHFQKVHLAMVMIASLSFLVAYMFFKLKTSSAGLKLLILPYLIWLTIACSLNLYVIIYN